MSSGVPKMLNRAAVYAPPSALLRALISFVLLLGFYAVLVSIAVALLVAPIGLFIATHTFNIRLLFVVPFCWIPALLLLQSAVATRKPEFIPPPRRLTPADAPALFAMVEELATRAKTAPPVDVYLDFRPNLAVLETGSLLRTRRTLIIGAPLLFILTTDELRAGIAHELGHFVGGDTRLNAFSSHAHGLFASVLNTVERDAFREGSQHIAIESGFAFAKGLGEGLVRFYGAFFLRVMRPFGRRQELAADALAANLVGPVALASLLEKVSILGPLYDEYLQHEVGYSLRHGAMPTDLLPGFDRMREQLLPTERGQEVVKAIRARPTDPYDTHPALSDRLANLKGVAHAAARADDRSAALYLANEAELTSWLAQITRDRMIAALLMANVRVREVRELPWEKIPNDVYAPAAREAARRAAERLFPLFPQATSIGAMFAAVWQTFDSGNLRPMAVHLNPSLEIMPPQEARTRAIGMCFDLLGTLLQGALLERGAHATASLGEPSLSLELDGQRFSSAEALSTLLKDPNKGRPQFSAWAAKLGAPMS